MRTIILGGGPAGLYCGLLLKKSDPSREITIYERNPPDATYGWGVVFSDRTLASFRDADYKTYREVTDHFVLWDTIDVHYRGEVIRCGGHIFAGLPRQLLLDILRRRCAELGVTLRYQTEVADLAELAGSDLLVAADGVNSLARKTHETVFQPSVELGRARYIWYGTDRVLDAFTFIFREDEHGLFQVHAYPFSGQTSTFIVECDEPTWQRAGLDTADTATSIAYCERLFAGELRGCRLLSNNSKWISFATIKNRVWHHGNLVLLGDAAHTAHFSIGSGTKLAMEDAIALANAVDQHADLATALGEYELERRPVVEAFQAAAQESRLYFEQVGRYLHLEPAQFTFHLLTRSGRISYDDLRLRDARFVARVDRWFAGPHPRPVGLPLLRSPGSLPAAQRPPPPAGARGGGPLVVPPPAFAPLRLRGLTLANRVAVAPGPAYAAVEGTIGEEDRARLEAAASTGAALVLTEPVAVAPEGRVTPRDPCLYDPAHATAWADVVARVRAHSPARIALQLGHAGRRGATRPRWRETDRPLPAGDWPLLAPSPLPYTARSQVPRAMDPADMERVRLAYAQAARLAATAGFDLLQLQCGHGYLLGSFLSPLTNQRDDEYGGPLEHRLRFPLAVFDAMRAAWPDDRPLAVALSAGDCAPGGFDLSNAVAVARVLVEHGCDLITVLAGQTIPDAEPAYGRGFLTPLSDRLRNEARVATMVGGYLTTIGEINTILAAGRADLCILELPEPSGPTGAYEAGAESLSREPSARSAGFRPSRRRSPSTPSPPPRRSARGRPPD